MNRQDTKVSQRKQWWGRDTRQDQPDTGRARWEWKKENESLDRGRGFCLWRRAQHGPEQLESQGSARSWFGLWERNILEETKRQKKAQCTFFYFTALKCCLLGHPFLPSLETGRLLPGRNLKAKGGLGRGASYKVLGSPQGTGKQLNTWPRMALMLAAVGVKSSAWESFWPGWLWCAQQLGEVLRVRALPPFATANWFSTSLTKFRGHQTSPQAGKSLMNGWQRVSSSTQLARKEPEPSSYTERRQTSQELNRKWLPPHEHQKPRDQLPQMYLGSDAEWWVEGKAHILYCSPRSKPFFPKAGRIMESRKNKARVQVCWCRSRVGLSWSRPGSPQ